MKNGVFFIFLQLGFLQLLAANSQQEQIFFPDFFEIPNRKLPLSARTDNIQLSASSNLDLQSVTAQLEREIYQATGSSGNVLFSPVSIIEILGLLLLGANGTTRQEIAAFLSSPLFNVDDLHRILSDKFQQIEHSNNPAKNLKLHLASGLFIQDALQVSDYFSQYSRSLYDSETQTVNFKTDDASKVINNWVNNKTSGLIPKLDTNFDPSSLMAIVSTVFFHGDWEKPFNGDVTHKRDFFPHGFDNDTEKVVVDMMGNVDEYLVYTDFKYECSIVALPYKGSSTVFYAIQPFASSIAKLREFKQRLTPGVIQFLISNLKRHMITLLVPKMSLTKTVVLNSVLQKLNMKSMFHPKTADLSLVLNETDGENIYVGEVVHQVKLDVTETGTTAAAATSANIARSLHTIIKLDTPFLFFIRHLPSNLDLFWGSIEQPTPFYAK